MSSPPDQDQLQRPQRKPSTSLLGGWKNLIRSRGKGSDANSSLITSKPARAILTDSDAAIDTGVLREVDLAVDAGEETASARLAAPVVGGPDELDALIAELSLDNSWTKRAIAASTLSTLVKHYPASNLLSIWNSAQDLWDVGEEKATTAARKLFMSCVSNSDLSPAERRTFFNFICQRQGEKDRNASFAALVALTDHGKDVGAIEEALPLLLTSMLKSFYASVAESRKRDKKSKAVSSTKEEELLSQLLHFIGDVAKYNSKLLDEAEFNALLGYIIEICRTTGNMDDLSSCVQLIGALITYTHVPVEAIPPCVEVLADVYRQIDSLRKAAWNTFKDLFRSHLGHSAISALLSILKRASKKEVTISCVRGAFQVLARSIARTGKPGNPTISVNDFVAACQCSLAVKYKPYYEEVVQFFLTAMFDDILFPKFVVEAEWSQLLNLIMTCAELSTLAVSNSQENSADAAVRSTSPSTTSDFNDSGIIRDALSDTILQILDKLNDEFLRFDLVQRSSVIVFFVKLSPWLGVPALETLLAFYQDENLLWPSHPQWYSACQLFNARLFKRRDVPTALRARMLDMLRNVFEAASSLDLSQYADDLALLILENVLDETDLTILDRLATFATNIALWAPRPVFESTLKFLRYVALNKARPLPKSVLGQTSGRSSPELLVEGSSDSQSNIVSKSFVRIFLRSMNMSATKANQAFEVILEIAGSDQSPVDARITALKLLFRIRCDSNLAIYVNPRSEGESMAAVLCRTTDTAQQSAGILDSPSTRRVDQSHESGIKNKRTVSGENLHRTTQRRNLTLGFTSERPLWTYPDLQGLPEEPSKEPSPVLIAHPMQDDEVGFDPTSLVVLRMDKWLLLVNHILIGDVDWELYSYTLAHCPSQLANGPLFNSGLTHVQNIRSLLCEQIKTNSFPEPPNFTMLRKSDVAVCIFQILTILIGYHRSFSKSDEDEMVRTFLLGIGGWDTTANWSIHALSVSCHELQASVSKSLEIILQRMSQIITQTRVQIHVLEFLAGLSRLPELFKNFREHDYKLVFGICFLFLRSSRDDRTKKKLGTSTVQSKSGIGTLRHTGGSRDLNILTDGSPKGNSSTVAESDLPQYVYALAYHVISFWFLSLRLEDRPKYIEWIMKNLTFKEGSGSNEREVVEEQGVVTIDLMQRVAWSERGETLPNENFAGPVDGEVMKKSWLVGLSIVTIETAGRTGLSQVTIRRPSTTRHSIIQPLPSQLPPHQVYLSADAHPDYVSSSAYIGVLPDDILQENCASLLEFSLPSIPAGNPVPLPDDDAVRRALSIFDRNVTVDCHKVGIIFIGDGQTSEEQILANVAGSADYTSFTTSIGTLMRLKGAKFNSQGLDREFDSDGEFTIAWRDRVTELMFHVTTMMPTDLEHDPQSTRKKSHIGNDFVNIVWNNSRLPFDFNTFPSAFNYVYIVVTPTSRASFVETRTMIAENDGASTGLKSETQSIRSSATTALDEPVSPTVPAPERQRTPFASRYYHVQVLSAAGFPAISPAAEGKVISGKALPHFVRLLALNASVFSHVWANRDTGETTSSWRNRLREIYRLRDKYVPQQDTVHDSSRPLSSPLGSNERHHSGMIALGTDRRPAPQMRDSATSNISGFKRFSNLTFGSDGATDDGVDFDRRGSEV